MNLKEKFSGKVWFISDLHYGHENILKHCPLTRPFKDVDEMNRYILKELEEKIGPDDVVFDLGDFIWKPSIETLKTVRNSIKSKRVFKVLGNHDKESFYRTSGLFEKVGDLFELTEVIDDFPYRLILSHYPLLSWNHKSRGSINLHGHCHGNLDDINEQSGDLRVDVGFDGVIAKNTGSFIISLEDVLNYFKHNNTEYEI